METSESDIGVTIGITTVSTSFLRFVPLFPLVRFLIPRCLAPDISGRIVRPFVFVIIVLMFSPNANIL